ncbi:MAG: methionine--tRNA ligase subunit beta [Candidatus Acetothermia bacterium]|jgi:methionyl-tRNA synthetase|nr:methionine--tRNA ligase subunit beta [Candidatus Acetothermia bacterium]MDH7505618.1 methionine--tRNA ligase subunit beta [Candidatus Acetothermia bacterium]
MEGVKLISIEQFREVDLRVATVLSAERVPGAEKLLKLEVDLGGERRPLVAGIAQHYRPEELVGRQIIVVANLQPAVIRGVESRGMLLAAVHPSGLALVTVDREAPNGARVS